MQPGGLSPGPVLARDEHITGNHEELSRYLLQVLNTEQESE
jgi:hypothetical protein